MVYEAIAASGTGALTWAYIVSAFLSGLTFVYLSKIWEHVPRRLSLVHFFIVTWSGLMYLNLVEGQTFLSDFVWYMDWMVSTPLIVLALALTATYQSDKKHYDLIAALMGLQFMVIVTGVISQSAAAPTAYAFWLGCLLLAGVAYILWVPLRKIAEETSEVLARKYKILAGYITVFFTMYPAVWYLSEVVYPQGPGVLGGYETFLAFVILPFFCKQVYGFMDLYLIQKAGDEL